GPVVPRFNGAAPWGRGVGIPARSAFWLRTALQRGRALGARSGQGRPLGQVKRPPLQRGRALGARSGHDHRGRYADRSRGFNGAAPWGRGVGTIIVDNTHTQAWASTGPRPGGAEWASGGARSWTRRRGFNGVAPWGRGVGTHTARSSRRASSLQRGRALGAR